MLGSLVDGLSGTITRALIWRGLTEVGAAERTRRQHRAIFNAIAAHRPDLAQV